MTASLLPRRHRAGISPSTIPRNVTNRLTGAHRTASTTNLLPRWRLDPRMHLSRCPIFWGHFSLSESLLRGRQVAGSRIAIDECCPGTLINNEVRGRMCLESKKYPLHSPSSGPTTWLHPTVANSAQNQRADEISGLTTQHTASSAPRIIFTFLRNCSILVC